MGLAVTEEQRALAEAVRGWCGRAATTRAAREAADAAQDRRPAFWPALAAQELLGLPVPERFGGAGADLVAVAVVVEELGRGLAPGPYLPTVLGALLLQAHGTPEAQELLLPAMARGELTAGVAPGASTLQARPQGSGYALDGTLPAVLSAETADLLLLPVLTPEGEERWVLADAEDFGRRGLAEPDPTRRCAEVTAAGVVVPRERLLTEAAAGQVRLLAGMLLAAEAAGVAGWCLDTAVAHAKVREQFGRPIGAFQAVKHRCADMLAKVETAAAAAWDAARAPEPLAVAVAVSVALDAAVECAKGCIQVLGGIGYTWEHDAHRYLKRALAARAFVGGTSAWRRQAAALALSGVRRETAVDLPAEAAALRAEVRGFLAGLTALDEAARRRAVADAGYLTPHWPSPWGRAAGAVEQIVVDQEFRAAGVTRPDLVIGNWALPTIIQHGTEAQQERFVRPTLYGEITWCQMFSEPGAGSDLASLQTKAVRTDGGWLLSGQKVWTSMARTADWAICLARTDTTGRRHDGITYFLVEMRSEGLDVRPLRELTGEALFNEIFLTDVFVPDDCVVGEVGGGWRLARTTLANERVAMSSGAAFPSGVEDVLRTVAERPGEPEASVLERVGALVCGVQAEALLGLRTTLHQLSGTDPGAASSVRKLVGMHHRQDAAELALDLLEEDALAGDARAAQALHRFLSTRALTIAGGTSEVLRNVVGERLLGLPRD